MRVAAADVEQLDHDVEDRAGRDGEERAPAAPRSPTPGRSRCRRTSGRRRSGRAGRGSAQLGRSASPDIGPTMPKPSVALCSAKPMIRTSASETSSGAAAWPIARPSPKLCRPMPVAIRSASRRAGVRRSIQRARAELVDRGRARPDERRGAPAASSSGRSRRGSSARRRSRRRAAARARRTRPQSCASSGGLDRLDAVREHVPEQEDAGCRSRRPSAPRACAATCSRTRPSGRPRKIVKPAIAPSSRIWVVLMLVRVTLHGSVRTTIADAMATGHAIDEYLETIYFLAFPIGEYTPAGDRLPDARVARRRDARRLARLGRRDAEAARGGRARRARRAQGGDPHPGRTERAPSRSCASTASSSGCSPTSWATRPPRRTCTPTSSATRSPTTWSSGSTTKLGHPDRCPHGWPVDPDFEQAENRELAAAGGARARHARDDRAPRRARRRPPALVLRPGPRARHRGRAARRRAGRRPVPRRASSGVEKAIGEKAAAGFVRPRA